MKFVNFTQQVVEPFNKEFAEDIIDGPPEQRAWSHFVGNDSNFKSTIWDSTAGVFRSPMNQTCGRISSGPVMRRSSEP